MKHCLIALAGVLALTTAANANCSTANLAGTWTSFDGSEACTAIVSSSGVVSGSCGPGTISMTANCKWTGKFDGKNYVGRAETIPNTSNQKPNLMVGVHKISATNANGFFAFRN